MNYTESYESIVVTGSRIRRSAFDAPSPLTDVSAMEAEQEQLGAVKLYRIPEPVTVAANAQKQVALMTRPNVRVETVYRDGFGRSSTMETAEPTTRYLVTRNRTEDGLGLPLPAGTVAIFVDRGSRPFLAGEAVLSDHAVGDDVEISMGPAPGVSSTLRRLRTEGRVSDYEIVVTSDRPHPIVYEADFYYPEATVRARARLGRRDGSPFLRTTIAAHGRRVFRFQVETPPDRVVTPPPARR
jgi:hypothetical protein